MPSEVKPLFLKLGRTIFLRRGILYLLGDLFNHGHLDDGSQYRFCGFPPVKCIDCSGWFSATAIGISGKSVGLFQWNYVFSPGIASILIVVFQASVNKLIPLYAIGVFTSFTLISSRNGQSLVEIRADETRG